MREVTGALRVFGVEGGGTALVAGMRPCKKGNGRLQIICSGIGWIYVGTVYDEKGDENNLFTRAQSGGTIKPNICSVLLFCWGVGCFAWGCEVVLCIILFAGRRFVGF